MARSGSPPTLGKLELRIMQIFWRQGAITARQITDTLNEGGEKAVAHSTVQTILRKMEAKGAVAHESDGRIFLFRALHGEGEVTQSATRDLLTRVFGGSPYALVAHLLKHENVPAEERAQLRALVNAFDDTDDRAADPQPAPKNEGESQ
jgi:BlaI family transcriptional regulator, penicillinase repressor